MFVLRQGIMTYTASRHPSCRSWSVMAIIGTSHEPEVVFSFCNQRRWLWMPENWSFIENKGALLVERKVEIFNFQVLFPNDVCFLQYPTNRQTSHAVLRGGKRGFVESAAELSHIWIMELCDGHVNGGSVYFTEISVEMTILFLQQIAYFWR